MLQRHAVQASKDFSICSFTLPEHYRPLEKRTCNAKCSAVCIDAVFIKVHGPWSLSKSTQLLLISTLSSELQQNTHQDQLRLDELLISWAPRDLRSRLSFPDPATRGRTELAPRRSSTSPIALR